MEPFSSISNAWVPFSLFSRDTFRKTKTPESWHSPKEVWKISSWLYLPEFSRCFNIGILFSSILTTIQRKHVIQTLLFLTANDCGASYNRNTRSSLRMQRQSTTNYQRFSQFFRVFKRGTPLMATMAPINRFFFYYGLLYYKGQAHRMTVHHCFGKWRYLVTKHVPLFGFW